MIRESKFTANQFWMNLLWKQQQFNSSTVFDPTAYYAFENLLEDSTGNGSTLVNQGGVIQAAGKVGLAASFDGTNWLETPVNTNVSPLTDVTIACWINPDPSIDGHDIGIISTASGNSHGFSLHREVFDNSLVFLVQMGNGQGSAVNNEPNATLGGVWTFVIASYTSATKTLRLRVNNGVARTNANIQLPYSPSTTGNFTIGKVDATVNNNYKGLIDEVGVWNKVLTPAEETALWNGGSGI